ncbi:bactofilin family protein [Sessilibacter sp. MAH2]
MFNKKSADVSTPKASKGATTLISNTTEIKGDLAFSGNLMIEGKVFGNITAAEGPAHLQVLDSGEVIGEIRVPTIIINGRVRGDVYSSEHVELAERAVVDGNVHYALIEMVKGSQVNGNLVFEKVQPAKAPAKSDKPSAKSDSKQDLKNGGAEPINA